MFRIAASALALAAASLVAPAPAEAAPKCTCVKKQKSRAHHRAKPRHRTVAKAPKRVVPVAVATTTTVTTTKAIVDAETYISPESLYLPDPQHNDHVMWPAAGGEIAIASALNASLDLWRTCSWKGQEEAAAAFVAWSRTHTVAARGSRVARDDVEPAWKPFGRASAQRVAYMDGDEGFNAQPVRCDVGPGERAALKADMEQHARALARTHAAGHRAIR